MVTPPPRFSDPHNSLAKEQIHAVLNRVLYQGKTVLVGPDDTGSRSEECSQQVGAQIGLHLQSSLPSQELHIVDTVFQAPAVEGLKELDLLFGKSNDHLPATLKGEAQLFGKGVEVPVSGNRKSGFE